MLACRRAKRRAWLVAATLAAFVLVWRGTSSAADNPNGKIIAEVVPDRKSRPHPRPDPPDHALAGRHGRTTKPRSRKTSAACTTPSGSPPAASKSSPRTSRTAASRITRLRHRTDQHRAGRQSTTGRSTSRRANCKRSPGCARATPMNPLANELGRQAHPAQVPGRRPLLRHRGTGRGQQADRHPRGLPDRRGAGGEGRGRRVRRQRVTPAPAGSGRNWSPSKKFLGPVRRQVQPGQPGPRPPEAHRVLPRRSASSTRTITPEVERTETWATSASSTTSSRARSTTSPGRQIDGNKSFRRRTARLAHRTEARRPLRPPHRCSGTRPASRTTTAPAATPSASNEQLYEVPDQPGIVQVHYEVLNDRGTAGPRRADHHRGQRRHQGPRHPEPARSPAGANPASTTRSRRRPTCGWPGSASSTREQPPTDRSAAERARHNVQGHPRAGAGNADRAVHGRRRR